MTVSIADAFQGRLNELIKEDVQSQNKTRDTLARIKTLIVDLEKLDLDARIRTLIVDLEKIDLDD